MPAKQAAIARFDRYGEAGLQASMAMDSARAAGTLSSMSSEAQQYLMPRSSVAIITSPARWRRAHWRARRSGPDLHGGGSLADRHRRAEQLTTASPKSGFYHLQVKPLEQVLPHFWSARWSAAGARPCRRSRRSGLRVLDDLLWTYANDSFLPHGVARRGRCAGAADLSDGRDRQSHGAQVRFLVDGAEARPALDTAAQDYERIVILFDGNDEDQLAAARAQWKVLKGQGSRSPTGSRATADGGRRRPRAHRPRSIDVWAGGLARLSLTHADHHKYCVGKILGKLLQNWKHQDG